MAAKKAMTTTVARPVIMRAIGFGEPSMPWGFISVKRPSSLSCRFRLPVFDADRQFVFVAEITGAGHERQAQSAGDGDHELPIDPLHSRDVRYSSVTQPSEAFFTLLMYLYSVPRVAL